MPRKAHVVRRYFDEVSFMKAACKFCKANLDEADLTFVSKNVRDMKSHLKNCPFASESSKFHASSSPGKRKINLIEDEAVETVTTSQSQSVISVPKNKKRSIFSFMDRPATKEEKEIINRKLIVMFASTGVPFSWIDNPAVIDFLKSLRSNVKDILFSKKVLTETWLPRVANFAIEQDLPLLKTTSSNLLATINLLVDGWDAINSDHVLGCILSSEKCWVTYCDDSGNVLKSPKQDAITVAEEIENKIIDIQSKLEVKIGSVVTDSAAQLVKAKRILAFRWPDVYFGPCFAHIVNLITKDTLNVLGMKQITRAKGIIKGYKKSVIHWLKKLDIKCFALYGQRCRLVSMVDTRWNSAHASICSILRIRSALASITVEEPNIKDKMKVDPLFIDSLEKYERILRPLVVASFLMQRDYNDLGCVTNLFGSIYRSFAQHNTHSPLLIEKLENRWKKVGTTFDAFELLFESAIY